LLVCLPMSYTTTSTQHVAPRLGPLPVLPPTSFKPYSPISIASPSPSNFRHNTLHVAPCHTVETSLRPHLDLTVVRHWNISPISLSCHTHTKLSRILSRLVQELLHTCRRTFLVHFNRNLFLGGICNVTVDAVCWIPFPNRISRYATHELESILYVFSL
jgi:hypothetical protein